MFTEINEFALLLAPVIICFMQAVKKTNLLAKDILPIVSVFVGVMLGFLFFGFNLVAVQVGLIASLISMGCYDVVKKSLLRK